jgi:hypothetical protein
MTCNKIFIFAGVFTIIALIILGCWLEGLFTSENKLKKETSIDKQTDLNDAKVGKLDVDEAFKELKKFKQDFDKDIFKELLHSLRALTGATKERLKSLVEMKIGEKEDAEELVKVYLVEVEKRVKKVNDKFFGSTGNYETYLDEFFDIDFEKKDKYIECDVTREGLFHTSRYVYKTEEILKDNKFNLNKESRKKIKEYKYVPRGTECFTSAFNIMNLRFLGYIFK